jgi:hypothetical protein
MLSDRREPKSTGEPIVIYGQRPGPVEPIGDKLMELCLIVSEIRHAAHKALARDRSSPDAEILQRASMQLSSLIRGCDARVRALHMADLDRMRASDCPQPLAKHWPKIFELVKALYD